jgi:hypothetical protein
MTFPSFTTGEVLTAADMNAVGLWLVKTQTIGSAVSSVTVSSCFSVTYNNYKITVDGADASNDGADIRFSLAGITGTWYYNGYYMIAASSTLSGINGANQAYAVVGITGNNHWNISVDVFNPFASLGKFVTSGYGANGSTNTYVGNLHGVNASTTSAASFTLTPSAGTLTGGTIRVYGYRN